jgi:hypothetical protein
VPLHELQIIERGVPPSQCQILAKCADSGWAHPYRTAEKIPTMTIEIDSTGAGLTD